MLLGDVPLHRFDVVAISIQRRSNVVRLPWCCCKSKLSYTFLFAPVKLFSSCLSFEAILGQLFIFGVIYIEKVYTLKVIFPIL